MALTNNDRVGKALQLLAQGLAPVVERECRAVYGKDWLDRVSGLSRTGLQFTANPTDVQFLLRTMVDNWQTVFKRTLGHPERAFVGELIETRNSWAHQKPFSGNDAQRALDTIQRLLGAISCVEQQQEVERMRQELLRTVYAEQARSTERRAAVTGVEGQPQSGLRPWREVVTPHPDVASGRYQQAEFAADLYQVWKDEAAAEYGDPVEFFRRTFITDGLRDLLLNAARRLSGDGGDPIVELQTNFGGGKTHSLIALYHLASGYHAKDLPGVEAMLADAKLSEPPRANIAVVVGQRISPSTPSLKVDGTEVHTLWGELAYQLGGPEAYALIAEDDRQGTNPGVALTALFRAYAPCLILIDEWVRYAGQLYGKEGLGGGSFDAQFSFAQGLSDAVKDVPNALLVVSIPSSEIEQGGEGGRSACLRLRDIMGRMSRPWRPASAEEGFEIVRRRLFDEISADGARERDAVVRAFASLYERNAGDFPADCRSGDYVRRLTAAYPIHPELFDRLFRDWSSLETFQRTRGVLRLLAAVIHQLWEREDRSLSIMPASVPIDAGPVLHELTRYLEDSWIPVIESDIDGPNSLPLRIDRENPNLARYSAARRVARTVYMGSAPAAGGLAGDGLDGSSRPTTGLGIDDRAVKLGCTQPGESPATFGDALRRLANDALYLNADGHRYWYSLRRTLTRDAADRAASRPPDIVDEEIRVRLRAERDRGRGPFAAVHAAPRGPADVPDEPAARLVLLDPGHSHTSKSDTSHARRTAATILEERSAGGRLYRNCLVFCAADSDRLDELCQAVRLYLAWKSIEDEWKELGLSDAQRAQAERKRLEFHGVVNQRIAETYQWVLLPSADAGEPANPTVTWDIVKVSPGPDPLAERVARRISSAEGVITTYGGTRLVRDLDRIPLWRGDNVRVRQLWLDHAQYLYLPRLANQDVLLEAICDGVANTAWDTSTFAYAEALDETTGRYAGLVAGRRTVVTASEASVVVKAEVAQRQFDGDRDRAPSGGNPDGRGADGLIPGPDRGGTGGEPTLSTLHRFYGRVELDPLRLSRDADQIAEAIVQHLRRAADSSVRLSLEIEATSKEGFDAATVRTVVENANTLHFEPKAFEPE